MARKVFILAHKTARERAAAFCHAAIEGWMVVFSEPTKKRIQEEKYHAMIDDIARQTTYAGQRWSEDDMKRILIDEFADEMRTAGTPLHHDGRLIPSENGRRVIQLGIQSSKFYVGEASAFIDFLDAWGTLRGVVWSDPKIAEDR